MNIFDARNLFAWSLRWRDNAYQNRTFTAREIAVAVDHWRAGIDPWESAAAICEGRDIGPKKKKQKP